MPDELTEAKLEKLEARLERLEASIERVKAQVEELTSRLDGIEADFDDLLDALVGEPEEGEEEEDSGQFVNCP